MGPVRQIQRPVKLFKKLCNYIMPHNNTQSSSSFNLPSNSKPTYNSDVAMEVQNTSITHHEEYQNTKLTSGENFCDSLSNTVSSVTNSHTYRQSQQPTQYSQILRNDQKYHKQSALLIIKKNQLLVTNPRDAVHHNEHAATKHSGCSV